MRALALLALLLVTPLAAACDLIAPPTNAAFLVTGLGLNESTRIPLAQITVGALCEITDPIAIDGENVTWAEPRDGGRNASVFAAPLARPDARSVVPVEGKVRGVTRWGDRFGFYVDGAHEILVDAGRLTWSMPLPEGAVVGLAFERERVAVETSVTSGEAEQRSLTLLDLENRSAFLPPTRITELGIAPLATLHALDGDLVLMDGELVDIRTHDARPLQTPGNTQLVSLDGGYAYAWGWRDVASTGPPTLYRAPLPSGDWSALPVAVPTRPLAVTGGRVVLGTYDEPPAIAWISPPGWSSASAWSAGAARAFGYAPEYAWDSDAVSLMQLNADDPQNVTSYHIQASLRQPNGTTSFVDLHQRVARQAGDAPRAFFVAPDALHAGVEVQEHGRALVLVAPPGALPDASAIATRLGLPVASFEDAPQAPTQVPLFAGGDDRVRFALDCGECRVVEARGALASDTFDSARAWLLPNGSLVAFRTTPWADITASRGLLDQATARGMLIAEARARGLNATGATLERVVLGPAPTAVAPPLRYEWRLALQPSEAAPFTSARADQDAASGGLVAPPDDFTIELPSTTGTAPTQPLPSAPAVEHPAPSASLLVTLAVTLMLAAPRRRR